MSSLWALLAAAAVAVLAGEAAAGTWFSFTRDEGQGQRMVPLADLAAELPAGLSRNDIGLLSDCKKMARKRLVASGLRKRGGEAAVEDMCMELVNLMAAPKRR